MPRTLDQKAEIARSAGELFMQYGIKSITMDDLARHLSISKKTIYQHYSDKKELVAHATRAMLEHERDECEQMFANAPDAIAEIHALSQYMRSHILKVNPSLFLDLQRYYKDGYKIYMEYKEKVFLKLIHDSLVRGQEEGFFRASINPQILARLRNEEIQLAFEYQVFPRDKFDFQEVQLQLFDHFVHGIITEKGRKQLQAYLNTIPSNESSQ